jgi:hypothetical protein
MKKKKQCRLVKAILVHACERCMYIFAACPVTLAHWRQLKVFFLWDEQ